MDKYAIISAVAPVIAPAAPATVLINTLYSGMVVMGVEHYTALGTSILSGIGAELSGMIAAYAVVQAYRKQARGHFLLALGAFGMYVLFMAAGIALGRNPWALVMAIMISIIAYLGAAILEDLLKGDVEKTQSETFDIDRMKIQTRLQNSLNRGAKIATIQPVQPLSSAVHVDKKQFVKISDMQIFEIQEYWKANPSATLREVAAACEVSPMTAGKYRP